MGAANLTSGLGDVAGNPRANSSFSFVTGPRPFVTRKRPVANSPATLSSLIRDADDNRVSTTSWRFTTRR